jgi:hypothetical protein
MTEANGASATPPARQRLTWRVAIGLIVLSVLTVIVVGAVAEITLITMLNHPPPVSLLRRLVIGYYFSTDVHNIQHLPGCARYDPGLGYTLKPGACQFSNREFDVAVRINSAGLRDDEADLRGPDAIVLGDSHAMGWGVQQNESFAELIGSTCAIKVLNAGISSYGTAREMKMLAGLDTSRLKWLVIQYNQNDLRENFIFTQDGDRIIPMPEPEYAELQREAVSRYRYYPGKVVVSFLGHLGRGLRVSSRQPDGRPRPPSSIDGEADLFLHALSSAPPLDPGVRVIVIDMMEGARLRQSFLQEVRKRLPGSGLPEPWQSMTLLDVSTALQPQHFFVLDEHPNAAGHRELGRLLSSEMRCLAPADVK